MALATLTTNSLGAFDCTISGLETGGNITNDGGETITARGVCWGSSPNPVIGYGRESIDGSGTGSFTSEVINLTRGSALFVRAYATNASGTAYGNEQTVIVSAPFQTSNVEVVSTSYTSATVKVKICFPPYGLTATGVAYNNSCVSPTPNRIKWGYSSCASPYAITSTPEYGEFNVVLNNLIPNTTYYARGFYETLISYDYFGTDDVLSFTTSAFSLATVTTNSITNITTSGATAYGNVTDDGGTTVTERGICWSTGTTPTTADNKGNWGTGLGSYYINMSSLTENTTYYVRAYAINSTGTAYGSQVSFTTESSIPVSLATVTTDSITDITSTGATGGGNVTDDGGGTITARGVCFNTGGTPTILDSKTTDGTGLGSFTSDLTGLSDGITYYVRAYATNSAGTAYGSQVSFTTTTLLTLATVTTDSIDLITTESARVNCTITDKGNSNVIRYGVCFNTGGTPTINNSTVITNGDYIGSYNESLYHLIIGDTTYYVRAFTTNSAGTAYGSQLSFTTDEYILPTLANVTVNSISYFSANTLSSVLTAGNSTMLARGFCWSTHDTPTINDNVYIDGSVGDGGFNTILEGLSDGTLYYIRSYATTNGGTAYGSITSFTTLDYVPPTVIIEDFDILNDTSLSITGNTITGGSSNINTRGFCWNTIGNPTINDNIIPKGSGIGIFSTTITDLNPNIFYYIKAYASNDIFTSYSNEFGFNTTFDFPFPFCSDLTNNYFISTATTCGNSDGYLEILNKDYMKIYDFTLTDLDGNFYEINNSVVDINYGVATGLTANYYKLSATVKNSFKYFYGNDICSDIWIPIENSDTTIAITETSMTPQQCGPFDVQRGRIVWNITGTSSTYNLYLYDADNFGTLLTTITGGTQFIYSPINASCYYGYIESVDDGCIKLINKSCIDTVPITSISGIKQLFITPYNSDLDYDYWKSSDDSFFIESEDTSFFLSTKIKRYYSQSGGTLSWYGIPVVGTMSLGQKLAKTRQGITLTDTLRVDVPKTIISRFEDITMLLGDRWVYVFEDNMGQWFTGGYAVGADVKKYSQETGERGGENKYSFEFSALSADKLLTALDSEWVNDNILT